MGLKICVALGALAITTAIPAPIPSVSEKWSFKPEMSQSQLGQQQSSSGTVQQVGQVPKVLYEGSASGHSRPIPHDTDSSKSLKLSAGRADVVGGVAIKNATQRVEQSQSKANTFLWMGAFFVVCGLLSYKAFRLYMNKITPVPKFSKQMLDRF